MKICFANQKRVNILTKKFKPRSKNRLRLVRRHLFGLKCLQQRRCRDQARIDENATSATQHRIAHLQVLYFTELLTDEKL